MVVVKYIRLVFSNLFIVFIVILIAFVIRLFAFEIYYIPSSSMENTLYEGDVVLVSKLHYGTVLPETPEEIPLFRIIGKGNSNITNKHLDYKRFWGFSEIRRGDVIVFKQHLDRGERILYWEIIDTTQEIPVI